MALKASAALLNAATAGRFDGNANASGDKLNTANLAANRAYTGNGSIGSLAVKEPIDGHGATGN